MPTRASLATEVDTSLPGLRVARVLDRIIHERGMDEVIVKENGPEFTSGIFDPCCWAWKVRRQFIQTGEPT